MKRYAFISIRREYNDANTMSFAGFYGACGANLGNMLFVDAVWNQVIGEKERLPYRFGADRLNQTCDGLIIPAANWLGHGAGMPQLVECLEKIELPVTVIGLGAQVASFDPEFRLNENDCALLKVIADRSPSISVRGPYTAELIKKTGIGNPVVTGCPSLFENQIDFEFDGKIDPSNVLFHATRYRVVQGQEKNRDAIDNRIFRLAHETGSDILFQSEPEELELLLGFSSAQDVDKSVRKILVSLYAAKDWEGLTAFLRTHGKVFLNLDSWAQAASNYSAVIGTRLHGTIKAVHSGTPGVLITHDSRTREIAEFFEMPSMPAPRGNEPFSMDTITEAFAEANFQRFHRRRKIIQNVYRNFLHEHNIETTL